MYYSLSYPFFIHCIIFMKTDLPANVICLIALPSPLKIVIKLCGACENSAQSIFRFSIS
jgi:hypothetical protein